MAKRIRVLIVEDSEDDTRILEREITKNGYELVSERVDTPAAMQTALTEQTWDIIISDYVMPRFSGLEALRILKESHRDIPLIIVSGKIGEETAVEAMRAGAHDYILKENLTRLVPAIERELAEAEVRIKQRQSDHELEQLHKHMETRVAEMVADLRFRDRAMIQQSRMASMGEMISNIAHQWRQPLNNVALIIQSIQVGFSSGTLTREEMDNDIHEAMEALQHMSRTIDDFRSFFKEDKEKKKFYISTAVRSALTLVSASLKNHQIQIELKNEEEEISALGYQNEYAQVLLNIISNAREAGIERAIHSPRISVRVTCENEHSVLYIRDNCGGIPDEVMTRIFDPYFTTRGHEKGTGIGLYMSKVIIEQHMGGSLTVRNVEGGAEFRIEV